MGAVSPLNIVIIGGSISGLMQGIVLRRSGHQVLILERSLTVPEGRGAGISCRENVLEFFDKWDLTKVPYYTDADAVRFLNREGKETRLWSIPYKSTSWASLYYKLRRNFDGLQSEYYPGPSTTSGEGRYELGQTVTNVKYDGERVTVECESTVDGNERRSLEADLVIVADGSRSRIRRILQPELIPRYAGYVAWRGLVPERSLSSQVEDFFGNHINLFPMGKGHMIIYFVPGDRGSLEPGERYLNWAWYCNYPSNSASLGEVMTDKEGHFHHNSMPVGKVSSSLWERQKSLATRTLPLQLADIVQKTEQPFIQSINELRCPKASFFDGKLLMVGDALASCRPHIASSTEQAASNAMLLHELVQGNISVEEWESRVLRFSHRAFWHSKSYGLYWQHGLTLELLQTLFYFAWISLIYKVT